MKEKEGKRKREKKSELISERRPTLSLSSCPLSLSLSPPPLFPSPSPSPPPITTTHLGVVLLHDGLGRLGRRVPRHVLHGAGKPGRREHRPEEGEPRGGARVAGLEPGDPDSGARRERCVRGLVPRQPAHHRIPPQIIERHLEVGGAAHQRERGLVLVEAQRREPQVPRRRRRDELSRLRVRVLELGPAEHGEPPRDPLGER